jgi:hypothetical protein
VLLDTDCLKYLEDEGERVLISRSLQAADFELWPTGINAIEAAQNMNPDVRRRGLSVVAALAGGRGLLPLPEQLLLRAAQALVNGEAGWHTGISGLEEILADPEHVQEEVRAAFQAFMEELEAGFDEMHDRARPQLQNYFKVKGLRDPWTGIPEFLEQQWMRVSQLDDLMDGLWSRLGLPGAAPHEHLLSNPVWRLFFELEGVAVFERAIVTEQPKRVHRADLWQVLCSAGARKRLLVTNDQGLRRAASAVLVGRYPMSRVMDWASFRACHPESPLPVAA